MRRRLKHVCHYPSLGVIRYKKLEKVMDVRYGPPPFVLSRITFWEHDPTFESGRSSVSVTLDLGRVQPT